MGGADAHSSVWHVVLHQSATITHETVRQFANGNFCHIACFEEADDEVKRPHYHLALEFKHMDNDGDEVVTLKSRYQIQQMIKSHFKDIKGTTDYTTHMPKPNQDLRGLTLYICKGKKHDSSVLPCIIFRDNEFIDPLGYHKEFHENQKTFKAQTKLLAQKRTEQQVKKKHEVIEAISATYKGTAMDMKNIANVVKDVVTAYKGDIADHNLFMIVQAISFEVDKPSALMNASERMLRKIFPQY